MAVVHKRCSPPRKTNMTGWRIHHEWVDVFQLFPIENGETLLWINFLGWIWGALTTSLIPFSEAWLFPTWGQTAKFFRGQEMLVSRRVVENRGWLINRLWFAFGNQPVDHLQPDKTDKTQQIAGHIDRVMKPTPHLPVPYIFCKQGSSYQATSACTWYIAKYIYIQGTGRWGHLDPLQNLMAPISWGVAHHVFPASRPLKE